MFCGAGTALSFVDAKFGRYAADALKQRRQHEAAAAARKARVSSGARRRARSKPVNQEDALYISRSATGYYVLEAPEVAEQVRAIAEQYAEVLANYLVRAIQGGALPWHAELHAARVTVELPGRNRRGEPNTLVIAPVFFFFDREARQVLFPDHAPNAPLIEAIYRSGSLATVGPPRLEVHPDFNVAPGARLRLLESKPPELDAYRYPLRQAEVIERTGAAGVAISARTLANYQKYGLVPSHHEHPTAEARYPSDIVERLDAIDWLKRSAGFTPKRLAVHLRPAWAEGKPEETTR